MADEIIIENSEEQEKIGRLEKAKSFFKELASKPAVHVVIGFAGGLIAKPAAMALKQFVLENFALSDDPAEELSEVEGKDDMPF